MIKITFLLCLFLNITLISVSAYNLRHLSYATGGEDSDLGMRYLLDATGGEDFEN